MKRQRTAAPAPRRIIKVGGLYRDTARGVTVTAEDHEIRGGLRTGRILVCAADGKLRFPRRWYCRDVDLAEVQGDLAPPSPSDDGVSP
jgi:hypothetical protein